MLKSASYPKKGNTQPEPLTHKVTENGTYLGEVDAKVHESNWSKSPIGTLAGAQQTLTHPY